LIHKHVIDIGINEGYRPRLSRTIGEDIAYLYALVLQTRWRCVRHIIGDIDRWLVIQPKDKPMVTFIPLDAHFRRPKNAYGTQVICADRNTSCTVCVSAVNNISYYIEEIGFIGGV